MALKIKIVHLSQEILENILQFLSFHEIAKCRAVSRKFNKVIFLNKILQMVFSVISISVLFQF